MVSSRYCFVWLAMMVAVDYFCLFGFEGEGAVTMATAHPKR